MSRSRETILLPPVKTSRTRRRTRCQGLELAAAGVARPPPKYLLKGSNFPIFTGKNLNYVGINTNMRDIEEIC